jgi:hypothetical protein
MKYMLLIHQGDTPTPYDAEAWGRLSEDEQQAVFRDYEAINATPGVTPGQQMQPPETATTVRVQDGRTLTPESAPRGWAARSRCARSRSGSHPRPGLP